MSAVPAAGHFRLRRGPEQWPLYFLIVLQKSQNGLRLIFR